MRTRVALLVTVLAVVAGSRAAHANLFPNQNPLPFGQVSVGQSLVLDEMLNEQGGNDNIQDIVPQGCGPDWTIVSTNPPLPAFLFGGMTLDVQIRFAPTARGPQSCTFFVQGTSSVSFDVNGTGTAPVSTVTPTGSIDFGSARLQISAIVTKTITITNTTTDATEVLKVNGVTLSGANAGDWFFPSLPSFPVPLGPNQSLSIDVKFWPQSPGTKNAQVNIQTTDPITPQPQIVPLTGVGTTGLLADSVPSFGNVTAGTSSIKPLTLTNSGTGQVIVTSGTISSAPWVTFSSQCAGSQSCTFAPAIAIAGNSTNGSVTLKCSPPVDVVGTQTANVVITSDADNNPAVTTVTCTAVKPDITITPNTPLAHDFGAVPVGTPLAWNGGLVITNSGGATLTYSITKGGTNPPDFAINSGCTAGCSLAPGQMAPYNITFTPAVQGGRSATLTINSNDQDAGDNSQVFTLSGTGGQATLTGTPGQNGTLAFGPITVGVESATQTITAMNTGNQTMNISSSVLTGGDFLLKSGVTGAQTVTPGNSATWTIDCKPLSRGAKSGTFVVHDDSSNLPTYTVNLTCSGQGGNLTTSPGSLAMGSVRLGATQNKTFTLSNTGELTVNISSATITPSGVGYTVSGVPASLAAGNNATVTVTFAPTTLADGGAATLNITSDWNSASVSLTGTPTSAVIGLNPSSYNFGNLTAGTSATKDILVTNSGTGANLTVTSATLSGATWMTFGGQGCSGTACTFAPSLSIAPAGSSPVTIKCAPPAATTGTQTATLTFTSDTNAGGTATATLTCSSVKPDIVITPNTPLSHDFGNVHVGTPAAFNMLTITNAGGANLTYTITRSSTGSSGDFTLAGPGCAGTTCTSSLGGGAAATYTVTFTPSASGPRAATLAITSNDQDAGDNNQSFGLTGTGTQAVLVGMPAQNGTLAFSMVAVASESATQMVTATNNGNEDMTITTATLTGADFLLKSGLPGAQTVTAGNSATWTIDCKPTSRGAKSGTFVVANSSTTPSYTVNLTCTGIGGNLTVNPGALAFGGVPVGSMPQKTFVLQNTGELPVTIASTTTAPSTVGYSVSGVPASLAAGAMATVTVTFAPLSGSDGGNATVTITSDWNTVLVSLTGDGQTVGLDVNPAVFDYGDVRWDQTKPQVFVMSNTSQSNVTVSAIALTAGGNFTMSNVPTLPFTLTPGQSKNVTVSADPNDTTLGTFTSMLEISDDVPAQPKIDVNLSVNSVSPALQIDPGMTVDFGAVDVVAATAKKLTITLHNTGNGPMDVVGAPALTGLFTSAAVTASTVAAGGSVSVDVSYLPTVVRTAASPDTDTLVFTIDGLISSGNPQPSTVIISLEGHGSTRHITLTGSPIVFPDTYRNPSDADAPTATVTVGNSGEAPLAISAVMLTGDPVFTLLDNQTTTVPGGQSTPFRVRFKPVTDTGSFTGTLTIMNDDTGTPMAEVPISGRAVSRMISVSTSTLDLGTTYVGVPVKASDHGSALEITNNDPNKTITVRSVVIDPSAPQFTIVDTATQTVAPGAKASFDVEFTPDAEGTFTGMVTIFLDDDPIPDGTVTVTGRGIPGRGSYYACSSSGGAGGLVPIGLAFAALFVRRRRRNR